MTKERKPFMDLAPDIDDKRLEKLAHDKCIATLVKPETDKAKAGERPQSASSDALPAQLPDDMPTPRSRMKNYSIDLPDYFLKELKIRAAHRETSIRRAIFTSLRLEG